ncbi:hypothetical protein [Hymenobacter ruricola]|uniref:hypothetical protein n=1 Tax=Hymenobacter ruricola TaxID=2791023 RepID=UPI0018B0118A|nr:hypothetical protein [Hymenobacter ruricola]
MVALSFSAHAQKASPVAAKIPPVDPCLPSFYTSQSTICQGGSAVLSFSPSSCVVTSTSYTYSWSPARDISATNTASVVVNPLVTTTYTITVTSSTGSVSSYSTTITVQANCCQTSTIPASKIVELNNDYVYNYGSTTHNDPFRQYPPGTTFHVTGDLTLHGDPGYPYPFNTNDKFTMPPGTVLLMDAFAAIYVQDGARLETNGATITAACNSMWRGLYVRGTSDQFDMHGVGTNPSNALMHNRIMHSMSGIVLEDHGPEFQLNFVDFLHNYSSMNIARNGAPVHTPSTGILNKIVYCTFDSDPTLMKAPYTYNGSADYWYSFAHIQVSGNVNGTYPYMVFQNNTLNHSMFGIRAYTATPLRLQSSTFSNFYLAGVNYASGGGPLPSVTGNDVLTLPGGSIGSQPNTCTFNFPSLPSYPATRQFTHDLTAYGSPLTYGTTGIRTDGSMLVDATSAVFRQATPVDHAAFQPHLQTGIHAVNLTATSNNFLDVTYGIAQDFNTAGTGIHSATQNLFEGCGAGYMFSSQEGTTGTALLDCNTFKRVSGQSVNTGQYFGIYVQPSFTATISGTGNVRNNKFLDGGLTFNGFQAIYNANSISPVNYQTYDDYIPVISQWVDPSAVNLVPVGYNYPNNNTDCVSGNGLPRQAPSVESSKLLSDDSQLDQNVPNPAHGSTKILYRVPNDCHKATLLVRRAMDGQVLETLPLDVKAQSSVLRLESYSAGTYFYTLLVDGSPVATRRLVVE